MIMCFFGWSSGLIWVYLCHDDAQFTSFSSLCCLMRALYTVLDFWPVGKCREKAQEKTSCEVSCILGIITRSHTKCVDAPLISGMLWDIYCSQGLSKTFGFFFLKWKVYQRVRRCPTIQTFEKQKKSGQYPTTKETWPKDDPAVTRYVGSFWQGVYDFTQLAALPYDFQ